MALLLSSQRHKRRQLCPASGFAVSALEPRLLLAATMVKDINTDSISSNPARFVALNGKTLFRADDGVHGNEWFVTNGSAQGTGLLLDVNPGHAGSAPLGAAPAFTLLPDDVATSAVMNGTMFFAGNDGTSGTELWTTDGTPAGTVRLKDIRPGPEGSSPRHLTVVGNSVYFVADDGTNGFELWRTDGTEDGTRMVADLTPPGDSFQPVPLGAVGDRLVFAAAAADIAGPGLEPWVTDGTPGGTLLLKDLRPSGGSDPGIVQAAAANLFRGDAAAVGDTLYFAANDAVHGRELWKTDGTSEGTVLVADKTAGTRSTSPLSLTVAGSSVYFRAFTGSLGTRVTYFKTDATSGVVSVGELGDESGMKMGALGGEFLLVVPIGGALRLYKLDPASPAGTQLSLVKALPDARGSSWGNEVIEWNGAAYFLARGNDGPRATMDLWRSDGTDAGTVRVARFDAPPTGVTPRLAVGGDDNLYFAATEVADGTEPYISDGTDAGTRRLVDLAPSSSDGVTGGVAAVETPTGTRGLFVATEREHGSELWVTDGTAAGTNLLKDINPGPASGVPANNFVFNGKMDNFSPPFNGRVYFQAEASGVGPELWASDGTEAGTYLVKDIVPGFNGSSPGGFTPFHGRMYFTLGTSAGVWVTDGTAEGTGMSDVPVSSAAGFHRLVVAGDWMYFALDGQGYTRRRRLRLKAAEPRRLTYGRASRRSTAAAAAGATGGPCAGPQAPARDHHLLRKRGLAHGGAGINELRPSRAPAPRRHGRRGAAPL
jgi:ELWxxDGT repeat protein